MIDLGCDGESCDREVTITKAALTTNTLYSGDMARFLVTIKNDTFEPVENVNVTDQWPSEYISFGGWTSDTPSVY